MVGVHMREACRARGAPLPGWAEPLDVSMAMQL